VDDDGVGVAGPAGAADSRLGDPRGEGGRGITGMRERALALGGTADAAPRPGRGFRVRARLPLTPSSTGRSGDPGRFPARPDASERTGAEPSDDRTTA